MRARRIMAVVICTLVVSALAASGESLADVFRVQLEMEKRLLGDDLARLEGVQNALRAATDRLLRLNDDLLRSEREGEDASSFVARSEDISDAESEVAKLTGAAQLLRATLAARRGTVDQLEEQLRRLEVEGDETRDELSGRWQVVIEPGGLRGSFDLRLEGTILTGVYQLAGGWQGSLRGTYIGGNIRLERIDSQLGLVALYTARLVRRGDGSRIEGMWESTNLSDGMAASGTWIAQRPAAR